MTSMNLKFYKCGQSLFDLTTLRASSSSSIVNPFALAFLRGFTCMYLNVQLSSLDANSVTALNVVIILLNKKYLHNFHFQLVTDHRSPLNLPSVQRLNGTSQAKMCPK